MKKVSFVCDCCGRTLDGSTLHALVRFKQCYPLCHGEPSSGDNAILFAIIPHGAKLIFATAVWLKLARRFVK